MLEYTLEDAQFFYDNWEVQYNPIRNLKIMMMYYHLISTEYTHHVLEPMYQHWYEVVRELPVDELYESINMVELYRLLDEEIEAQPHDDDTDLVSEYVKSLPLELKQSSVDEFFS